MYKTILQKLTCGQDLTKEDVNEVIQAINNDELTEGQISGFLAKGIYNTFGHTWGQIHAELLEIYYNYQYNDTIDESKYNKLLKWCRQMGYHVVEKELVAIKNDKLVHNNILFL